METEIRASFLQEGQRYAEFGGLEAATIAKIDFHGDTVLLTHDDGTEVAIDSDDVVILNPDED